MDSGTEVGRASHSAWHDLLIETVRAARARPSFALFLIALALLPFKWLTPFTHQQAGWTDVAMAAAFTSWLVEGLVRRVRPRLRAPHYMLSAYLLLVLISGVAASNHSESAQNIIITAELIAVWALTSDFARSAANRRAIAVVICAVVVVVAIQGALGLLLFYVGKPSSLVNGTTVYLKQSSLYTRVEAGFYSPPLLGSFCIFASAVVAMEGNGLSRRWQAVGQALLAALVPLATQPALRWFSALPPSRFYRLPPSRWTRFGQRRFPRGSMGGSRTLNLHLRRLLGTRSSARVQDR